MTEKQAARSCGWTRVTPLLVLAALACDTTEPVVEDQPVAFSASAEISSDTVFFRLNVTNVADTAVHLSWWGCPADVGAVLTVHDATGAGSQRWDLAEELNQGCHGVPQTTTITPGGEWSHLGHRFTVARILGDSLPDAQYRLFVAPAFAEDIPRDPIDVGVFTLAR